MDYNEVDRIIAAMGLANDPAFVDLKVRIEPIPNLNGCPLGLYFPEAEMLHGEPYLPLTIVVPPESNRSTLYHELGHRHGHYYHNDLSERYAEQFRMTYDSSRVLLYQGNRFDRLPSFGALFEEGEKGAVEIALLDPMALPEVDDFRAQLNAYGRPYGESCRVRYGNNGVPFLRVEFTRGIDWMVIIGATMAASAAALLGAMAYAIYKIAKISPWVVPVVGIGTAVFVIAGLSLLAGKTAQAAKGAAGRTKLTMGR